MNDKKLLIGTVFIFAVGTALIICNIIIMWRF